MPCFNSEIDEKAFYTSNKYINNVFLYAGALDVWQCFEETVKLYKAIEEKVENARFRVLVKNQEAADEILRKYNVKHYSLGFVPQDKIGEEMVAAKFGFCLRQDTTINRVATPTKLSTYVSNGVIPIYSDCLLDFYSIAKFDKFACSVPSVDFEIDKTTVEKIMVLCNTEISGKDVYNSFVSSFNEYFSKNHYISLFSKQLKDEFANV